MLKPVLAALVCEDATLMASTLLVEPMFRVSFAFALVAVAVIASAASTTQSGQVPLGTGNAAAPGVDHMRYAIPTGYSHIANISGDAVFLQISSCPPNTACAFEVICLAATARLSETDVAFEFTWAAREGTPIAELPLIWTPVKTTAAPDCQ